MRVTVIDYKAGNLTSVLKALRHLGAETEVTGDRQRVKCDTRINGIERHGALGPGHLEVEIVRAAIEAVERAVDD